MIEVVKFCSNCKKILPTFESKCPICGKKDLLGFCNKCKKIIPNNATLCPTCDSLNGKVIDVVDVPKNSRKKNHIPYIIVTIILILVFLFCGFFYYNNALWGNDKIAYDLVLLYAHNFKDPTSVRVVSGRAGAGSEENDFENYAFLRISAKNGFGGVTTGYYSLNEHRISDLEEDKEFWKEMGSKYSIFGGLDNHYDSMIKLCEDQTKLNVKKINKALQRKLG